MLSESSFIESSIFDLESGFSIVESGFLKRESKHESGFFPSPGFLRVRVQVRVRVRSGFRSMPYINAYLFFHLIKLSGLFSTTLFPNHKDNDSRACHLYICKNIRYTYYPNHEKLILILLDFLNCSSQLLLPSHLQSLSVSELFVHKIIQKY